MKKLIILLILITYPFVLTSQEQKFFLIKDIKTYSEIDGNFQHLYTYDTSGNELTHLIKSFDDDKTENLSYTETKYNENQDIIEIVCLGWENNDWQNVEKSTYTYIDSAIVESITYYKGNGKEWQNHEKYINKIKEPGIIDTMYYYIYKEDNWELNRFTEYFYDSNKNITRTLKKRQYEKFGSGWFGDIQEYWDYDRNNRLESWNRYYYNTNKMTFIFDDGFRNEYDDDGNLIEKYIRDQNWNEYSYDEIEKFVYFYESGLMVQEEYYYNPFGTYGWDLHRVTNYYYDKYNRLNCETYRSKYDIEERELLNRSWDSTYYDKYGNIAIQKRYLWNEDHWQQEHKKTYSYLGNKLQSWNFSLFRSDEWIDKYSYELAFDENENIRTVKYAEFDSLEWIPYHQTISILDSYDREYNYPKSYFAELDWTYVFGPVSVEESLKNSFKLYPNPTSQYLTVDFVIPENSEITITLYNVLGQKLDVLFSGNYSPGNFIRVFNLMKYPQGTYYLETTMNDKRTTKMIVIQR